MKTIFVVDDNDTNLVAAKTTLEGTYRTLTIPSAAKMFKLGEKITPDLILLDVEMPEMNGFEALALLKSTPKLQNIPVIFLTAVQDPASEIKGFELGALDFITKPFSAPVLMKRIEMHLEKDKLMKESQGALRNIQNAMISTIADLVEGRDKISGGRIEKTQLYLELLIKEMYRKKIYTDEISHWDLDLLLPSARLHDLGKIAISDLILNKPGKLTQEESAIIQTHTSEGERIIDEIISKTNDDGYLYQAKLFAGYHHEEWDGSGYPRHLSGTNIPLQGRILAIADVYDALISDRPYKKAFSHEEAVEIIKSGSGTRFDPTLVDVFAGIADDLWVQSMSECSN
jgi:putative two-component system response regulator